VTNNCYRYIYEEPDDPAIPDKRARIDEDPKIRRTFGHENLCRALIDVGPEAPMPVCSTMRCRYVHDVEKYLQNKPPDISSECKFLFKL